MSDDSRRPRRALDSDDSADDFLDEPGHSPSATGDGGSPFARPGSESFPAPRRSANEPYDPAEHEASVDPLDDETRPFRMPQRVSLPQPETMIPAPVLPERGEGYYEGPGPQPRRSALSSSTPPEPPAAQTEQPAPPAPPVSQPSPPPVPVASSDPDPWWRAHARSFVVAGLGVALLAVGVGAAGFYSARSTTPLEPSPSPSESVSAAPGVERVTQVDLLTEADVKALDANATWAITGTTLTQAEHTLRPACFSLEADGPDRLDSLQRVLASTLDSQLAVLHRLDSYTSDEAAQAALAERIAHVSTCDEVPTRILSSDAVTGIADEAFQISVVYEEATPQYHSMLLARTGNILTIVDTFNNAAPVATQLLVDTAARSMSALCERAGECSGEPTITASTVPPAEPRGWLIPSDLPRINAGVGRWTAQPPGALTSRGNGCEDMTLATVSGPTERLQSTFLVTQDDARPNSFGLDEMVFVFGDEASATTFATTLGDNLAGCADRVLGTEVASVDVGEGNRGFDITRETEGGQVRYQVSVVRQGPRVAYLMATVTDGYRFDNAQAAWITQRAGVRLGQAE